MRHVILLLLIWAGLLFPAVPSPAAETGTPSSPASPAASTPSCFVYIDVAPSGDLTVVERLKGFGPSLQRALSNKARPYGSMAPFVWDSDLEVVKVVVDGKPVTPNLSTGVNDNRYLNLFGQTELAPCINTKSPTRPGTESRGGQADLGYLGQIPAQEASAGFLRHQAAAECNNQQAMVPPWGHETVGHRPVTQWINAKGIAFFRGEEALVGTEYFVVSVEWNKGVVASDGSEQKIFTVQCILWGLFALLLLLCGWLWFKFGKDPRPHVSAPLFYPPLGPDGELLSPAAVAYIRNAAMLSSRGFAGLLLNLAAQNMVTLTGSGTRKDPYIMNTTNEVLERVEACSMRSPAQQNPSRKVKDNTLHIRHVWGKALERGCGFDQAERDSLQKLFPWNNHEKTPPPLNIGSKHSWWLAMARSFAYLTLAEKYRSMWQLQGGIVFLMFMLCYGGVSLVLGLLWALFGGGEIAVTLAMICMVGCLTIVCYYSTKHVIQVWVRWHEMGTRNLILLGVYVLLLPDMLLYDWILDPDMADFFLYEFMSNWSTLRILLWLGLMVYFICLTKSLVEVLLTPLKLLGYFLLFVIMGGTVFYANSFMGNGNIPFIGALLLPLFFMPIMKRPAQKAVQVLADIEGLAMYIGAAESQRLNFINPPERTPEEFHRLMPYAVALGLEKAWGAQFAGLLAEMRFKGSSLTMLAEYEHRMEGM